jgi:hypothetical protein
MFRHFRPRYAFKSNVQAFQAQVCIQVQCSGISDPGMDTGSKFRHFRPRYVFRFKVQTF